MSEEEKPEANSGEKFDVNAFINQRDIEHEITFSMIFNWFIGWPVLFGLFSFLTYTISKHYVTEPFIVSIFQG